ncbi:MAG: DUF881 domain-containing protein [Actinomycetota bacterium]|nr:DUF881 domain-containing protein [Actinomycetota bacterium]
MTDSEGRHSRLRRVQRSAAWRVGVVLICLIAGVMLGTARAISHGQDIHDRSADLSTLIKGAETKVNDAEQRAGNLQRQIDAAAAQDVSPQVSKARADAVALRPAAQLTAVEGPGVRVSLNDAPRDSDGNYPVGASPDDLVVHQQDVQSVVNALWAGGAEAMTIMNQRVLTTSAVRCIGNTLLLQGRTYSPPFVITAIGNADTMTAALQREPGVALFLQYVHRYALGFDVTNVDNVTLPGYQGLISMTSAQRGAR